MGFFSWIFGPSPYERDMAKKRAYQSEKEKKLFGSYSSAEDYAMEHRDDHGGFEEAVDAWERFKYKKK